MTKVGAARLLAVIAALCTDGHRAIAQKKIVAAARQASLPAWCDRRVRYQSGKARGDPEQVVEELLGEFEVRAGHWGWVADLAHETLTDPPETLFRLRSRFITDRPSEFWQDPGKRLEGLRFGAAGAVKLIRELGGPELTIDQLLTWTIEQLRAWVEAKAAENAPILAGAKVPANKKNKGGAPPVADWPALKDAVFTRIETDGLPNRDTGPDDWRTQEDVMEFVRQLCLRDIEASRRLAGIRPRRAGARSSTRSRRVPGRTQIQHHVKEWLAEIKERLAGKPET